MKPNKRMYVFGVTGGVGAGKSRVLQYIESRIRCLVIFTDEIANQVKEPGQICYNQIVGLLGEGILHPDGTIDRAAMAERIFGDDTLLQQVNEILHPEVRRQVGAIIRAEEARGVLQAVLVEAALLNEAGYGAVVDEMWYVRAEEDIRRQRLKASRGYSDEKIDEILKAQLDDASFLRYADRVIDNSGAFEDTMRQVDGMLTELGLLSEEK